MGAAQNKAVNAVAFSPDGTRLASGIGKYGISYSETVKVWVPAAGKVAQTLRHHDGVFGVAFSPDGTRLATAGGDSRVKVWDMATGELVQTLRGHSLTVTAVAFSPDGMRLASGSNDKTVKVWDAATGELVQTLEPGKNFRNHEQEGHRLPVWSVAFSPDGRRLVSSGNDNSVKVWDAATGKVVRTLKTGAYSVHSVAFSPDGSRLARTLR